MQPVINLESVDQSGVSSIPSLVIGDKNFRYAWAGTPRLGRQLVVAVQTHSDTHMFQGKRMQQLKLLCAKIIASVLGISSLGSVASPKEPSASLDCNGRCLASDDSAN